MPFWWTTLITTEAIAMTRMHNPPHPGEVLREYLGDTTVTAAAVKLGVNRVTLNRIVNGASGISADMAYRLASAFGTSAELCVMFASVIDCSLMHYTLQFDK